MANFTGRLALPCPPVREWGMNLATPPLALLTVALRAYDSTRTDDFGSPVSSR